MRTLPMKARKSKSSRASHPIGGLGQSFHRIQRSQRWERRRFIFSVALFVLTLGFGVFGAAGSFMQPAEARDNFRGGYGGYNGYGNGREYGNSRWGEWDNSRYGTTDTRDQQRNTSRYYQSHSRSNTTAPTQQRTQTPEKTTKTTEQPQQKGDNAASTAPAATPQIIPPSAAVSYTKPVDTSGAIATMVAAQAVDTREPVTYTSQQISTETRNRLLAVAVSAATSGLLIYLMSLLGVPGQPLLATSGYRLRGAVSEVPAR